jgi:hypothetical protein
MAAAVESGLSAPIISRFKNHALEKTTQRVGAALF